MELRNAVTRRWSRHAKDCAPSHPLGAIVCAKTPRFRNADPPHLTQTCATHKLSHMPTAPDADLVGSIVICEQLGISRSTLTRWVNNGTAQPAMRLPGKTGAYLFTRTEVERLATQHSSSAA